VTPSANTRVTIYREQGNSGYSVVDEGRSGATAVPRCTASIHAFEATECN